MSALRQPENRMAVDGAWVKPLSVVPDVNMRFADYCDKEASRSEMLELFEERWDITERLTWIDNGTIKNELDKFKPEYASWLAEQAGIEIDQEAATGILGEI